MNDNILKLYFERTVLLVKLLLVLKTIKSTKYNNNNKYNSCNLGKTNYFNYWK